MPQQWKYAIIMVLHKKNVRTECGNYRGISLETHAGKVLLKIIARRLSEYCERVEILQEEQSGFQPNRSTTDTMFVIRWIWRGRNKFRCMYALSTLPKRTTPLIEPSSGQYSPFLAYHRVIRQFCDGMRACVRLDDRLCSGWLAVEHGLCQGCMLVPLLFNIFAAVTNVASTRFKVDEGIMDALVHLRKKRRTGRRGEATAGEPVLATLLWGMFYADDAGVVSQSPKQMRKMMGVIVVVCAAFGLSLSEAKTEILCLRAKGMPESTAISSVEAAGQVYNQTNELVYLGEGSVNYNADLSTEVDRRIRNAWCSFRKQTLKLYNRPSAPLELIIRMLSAEVLETILYGCVTWSPRARATATRCAEPTTGS